MGKEKNRIFVAEKLLEDREDIKRQRRQRKQRKQKEAVMGD